MNLPYFVTSSKEESLAISEFLSKRIAQDKQIQFIPEAEGVHGSKALWTNNPSEKEYWLALTAFLEKL